MPRVTIAPNPILHSLITPPNFLKTSQGLLSNTSNLPIIQGDAVYYSNKNILEDDPNS